MAENQPSANSGSDLKAAKACKRVLVVDDEPDIVTLIKLQLEMEGYQVVTAGNGLEALNRVVEDHPDLIVLDIMMPKVDGWVVCHSVKSTPATSNIKVIILSANAQIRSKIKGLYILQADLYMTKPFNLEDLSGNICKLLQVEESLRKAITS